jgi:serine carboxypeptidase-like clade 2
MRPESWIIVAVLCVTIIQISRAVAASSIDDKILSLPGQPQAGFQQYAGDVTVDEKQQGALFYYLTEAECDPASKPVVLWLNRGT